ncbi:peptide ABC transporter permease [Marinomonas sp. SBI22]|uniref:ABC transporter permease n=1 Tax=unclassified Marinomonas TaxID=196814 RepID=UPI0007AF4F86|nr:MULTISPECIES: ABC transporter permease [unclassified Marinomonas]KZM45654.1 peptide ABC transporter permease [Marinomonas sp. SBI22]KZM46173.1 peptide ABC transporter permease [Marinomonas sp. SBI8L]
MRNLLRLAINSLLNRKATVLLSLFTIAISVLLLLGVEQVRTQAKNSFANTISGTDLIVGARSGQINLLLYSVFRIGNATNNIDWKTYQDFKDHKSVKWTVPFSLGDSHQGFRVLGTNQDYFKHYKFGKKQPLIFAQGKQFDQLFEAVIGADVAQTLGYELDSPMVLAHGMKDIGFSKHDNAPFKVIGILAPTGTPVDKTIHVSLEAIEAIHVGWESGAFLGHAPSADNLEAREFEPKQITAFLMGLKSKIHTFHVQREVNDYRLEPLSAIVPGIALHELWSLMSVAEQALLIVSVFVVIAGFLGMLASLLTSLNERRREMAILRALGARPHHIFSLLVVETGIICGLGIMLGMGLLYLILAIASPIIQQNFGLAINITAPSQYELMLVACIQLSGLLIGIIPAISAYRQSLSDGMTIRI